LKGSIKAFGQFRDRRFSTFSLIADLIWQLASLHCSGRAECAGSDCLLDSLYGFTKYLSRWNSISPYWSQICEPTWPSSARLSWTNL